MVKSKNLLMAHNSIVEYTGDDEIYCKLCKEVLGPVSLSLYNLQCHIKSSEHVDKVNEIDSLIEAEFIDIPKNFNDICTTAKCNICDCHLPYNYNNLEDHVNGKRHRSARSLAVQPLNGIFPVKNNDDKLWCKICDEYIDYEFNNDVLEHVDENEDHIERIEEIKAYVDNENFNIDAYLKELHENGAYCNLCKCYVPCNVDNLEQHINGNGHTNLLQV